MSTQTKAAATRKSNVISLRRKQEEKAKGRKVTLIEVMQDAVAALVKEGDGSAKVMNVVKWIFKRYPNQWAASTIQTYFCYMCRPRAFVRTKRGFYKNAGRSMQAATG